ncbi:MAG: HAMP domain-containing sensor histidine kinase [Clostridium sp.]
MKLNILLRNKEIRIVSLFFLAWTLLLSLAGILLININAEEANKSYINGNLVLAKRIIELDSGFESEVIRSLLTSPTEEEISDSKNVLANYGFSEDMDGKYSLILSNTANKFIGSFLIIIIIGGIVYFLVSVRLLKNVFTSISKISNVAEAVVLGNYDVKIDFINEDGEISKISYQIESMIKRLKSIIEELDSERQNLKNSISDISHQLRTPLAALVMNNSIIEDDEEIQITDVRKLTNKSSYQLERMAWLIENLLKMARFDAGVIKMKKKEVEIGKSINEAIKVLNSKINEKDIKLNFNGDKYTIINHDKAWTTEAIVNIVKNAIEHTDSGGKVEIDVHASELMLQIKISDNGHGIKEEDLDKIFTRYYKGEDSKNPTSIGIGLALSKKIIEEQGGSISVNSTLNVGTKFTITFLKLIV